MDTSLFHGVPQPYSPPLDEGIGYRLLPGEHGPVAVIGGLEMPLDQLSPEGASAIATGSVPFTARRPVSVRIHAHGLVIEELAASILAVHQLGSRSRVDLSFRGVDLSMARRVAAVVEELRREGRVERPRTRTGARELIVDPARIEQVCDALARNRARGLARVEGGPGSAIVRLCQFDRGRGLLVWALGGEEPRLPATVELIGHCSIFQLQIDHADEERPGRLVTALPKRILRMRRRSVGRTRVSGDLLVRFRHPVWPELTVERSVRDLSFGGLSFWGDAVHDLVYPGLELEDLEVIAGGPRPIRFSAEVKLVSLTNRLGDTRGVAQGVGLQLWPNTREDRMRWERLAGDLVYPTTRATAEWGDKIWEVFQDSGYFRLSGKSTEKFGDLHQSFLRMGNLLERTPHLGSRLASLSDRGVESTLSIIRAYRHTWMAHQFARRPWRVPDNVPKLGLRETLLRGFESSHLEPEIHWFLAYIEANVQWLRAANIDLARRYVSTGQAFVLEFNLFEGRGALATGIPEEVGPASAADLEALQEALARQFAPGFLEAFDLVPSRMDLAAITGLWAQAGLARERAVLMARVGGRRVAAAIVERSEPGTNLFNILDGVRIVFLEPETSLGPEGRRVRASLLAATADWYARRGHSRFVHYCEPSAVQDTAQVPGLSHLGPGFIWGLSKELMPEYTENVYELTSPRTPEPE